MRLDKFLAESGLGTRTEVKKLIKRGSVTVNNTAATRPEAHINENTDKILVDGEQIIYKKYIYLMLNKPDGYISATWDKRLPTVIDLLPEEYLHFEPFPVGRLDIDTEGLLVLTNDGALSHRLLSPKSHVPKTYMANIEKSITENDIKAFENRITLDDGYKTMPATLKSLSDDGKTVEVIIHEGKFHQVKRMFEAVGNKVLYLKRIAMNNLLLDEKLELGEVRELTEAELSLLEN